MNKKALLTAIAALTLCAAGTAMAQGNSDHDRGHDDRGHNGQAERRGPPGHDEGRGPVRRGPPPRAEMRHDERGAGPNHAFQRGQRLPPEYRNRQYVVNDWRGHRLSAPPRGYNWVQTGGDYVLVAIPTGLILQIHLGN
jgi:Ni/Co efflux regulator RcnB